MNNETLLLFLADDDGDDRQIFKEALEELTFKTKIVTFENGVELMANLLNRETQLPDFLFLDLNMPMMTGEECLDDIRNEPLLSKLPVVIYSTFFEESDAKMLKSKGADRYIQKPKSFALLKTCLERCLLSLSKDLKSTMTNTEFFIN